MFQGCGVLIVKLLLSETKLEDADVPGLWGSYCNTAAIWQ